MKLLRSPITWLILVLVGFTGASALRLNGLHLFNPDSPRYLIMSRAIINGHGYTPIDRPDGDMFMWRPPGVSVLLLPSSWLFPYKALPAKSIIVATALVLLASVYWLASRGLSRWWGVAVVLLVACSPSTLLFSTEVLSEAPFAAIATLVICLAARMPASNDRILAQDAAKANPTDGSVQTVDAEDSTPGRLNLWMATALMFCLPFFRSIGLALALALAVWAVIDRRRWRWSATVIAGIVATAGWMMWNPGSGGNSSYIGTINRTIEESGYTGLIAKISETSGFYVDKLVSGALPGVVQGRPWFFTVMLEGTRIPAGPTSVYYGAGLLVLALSVLGMSERRHRDGLAAFLYVVFYIGILTVWPFREQRYVWPLLPLIWCYVPAGLTRIGQVLESRRSVRLSLSMVGMFAVSALIGWQAVASGRMVLANQRYMQSSDEEFYATYFPPLYYCDWEAAGQWINENSQKHDRMLVRHCATACSAHRFQRMLYFEKKTPAELHQAIRAQTAKYLVIPSSQMPDAFQWRLLRDDPVYKFVPVYEARNVAVLEVQPNLTGTISSKADPPQIELVKVEDAAKRMPYRVDLQLRVADMLYARGEYNKSLGVMSALLDRRIEHVRAFNTIGWIWIQKGRPDEAIKWFERAAKHPDSKLIPSTIQSGFKRCQELMAEINGEIKEKPEPTLEELIAQATSQIESYYFTQAEKTIARIEAKLAPDAIENPELQQLIKTVSLSGASDLNALSAGTRAEAEKLVKAFHESRRLAKELGTYMDDADGGVGQRTVRSISQPEAIKPEFETLISLAQAWTTRDQPGPALVLLNNLVRIGRKWGWSDLQIRDLHIHRLKLQLALGQLNAAQDTVKTLNEMAPNDELVQQGAAVLESLLVEPRF